MEGVPSEIPPGWMGVIVSPEGEAMLCIPDTVKEDGQDEMPEAFLALTEVAMRFMRDPGFVADMAKAFEERARS